MFRPLYALVFLLPLAACSGESADGETPPLPVEIARVGQPSGAAEIIATGALEREREVVLSFRIPGVIRTLSVDDGDPVRTGALIAALDPTQVAAAARQTAAALEQARRDLARDERLAERGFVSDQRLADRRTAVEAAEAANAAAAFDRRWANLTSPVTGVVLARRAQAGEVVQPGQPVVVVADEKSPLVLRAAVPDADAARIRKGAPATVALGKERLAGQVSRIGERVEAGTGVVAVEVRIPARADLRSGRIATARIEAAGPQVAAGFVRVPAEAILEADAGRAFVFRLDEKAGVGRRTPVTFGGFDGDDALVSGLAPGSAVVTAGAGYLADGQKVAVIDPKALAGAGR